MSEQEMNRKMEFIIEQQAQFTVDIQLLRESLAEETKARQEQFNKQSESIAGLISIMGYLAEAQRSMEANIKALQEQSRETGERLNIFINVVERYISEGRNGRKPE